MNELCDLHKLLNLAVTVENDLDRLYHTAVRVRMPDSIMVDLAKNSANAFGLRRYIERKCDELG